MDEIPSTPAFVRYIAEELRVKEFITYANIFAAAMPVLLEKRVEFGPELEEWIARIGKAPSFAEDPASFRHLWLGMMVSRSVDNFHTYISEILINVFIARPETLRSDAKVAVREVLECSSIEEFAGRLATERVEKISHKGFPAMQQYLVDRLGVGLEFSEEDLAATTEAVATRNIVVHNRGRVNERFLRDTGRNDVQIGDVLPLERGAAISMCRNLEDIARTIDGALVDKFGFALFYVGETDAR